MSVAKPPIPVGASLAVIGLGGALGTGLRIGVEHVVPDLGNVPLGTLAVNLVGAFLLGFLYEGFDRRMRLGSRWLLARQGAGVGVLGGFTTYSTLVLETDALLSGGAWAVALGYSLVSLALGVVLAGLGVALARRLVPARDGGEGV